jgi:hypothetical protein
MKILVLRSSSGNAKSQIRHPKFLVFFCAMLLALSFPAEAQQTKKVPRIGFVSASRQPWDEAFRQGLHELGYVEGQNITIEYRYAEGKFERLPDLAGELVRLKVDVIVAGKRRRYAQPNNQRVRSLLSWRSPLILSEADSLPVLLDRVGISRG